jgi:hypothetical protein
VIEVRRLGADDWRLWRQLRRERSRSLPRSSARHSRSGPAPGIQKSIGARAFPTFRSMSCSDSTAHPQAWSEPTFGRTTPLTSFRCGLPLCSRSRGRRRRRAGCPGLGRSAGGGAVSQGRQQAGNGALPAPRVRRRGPIAGRRRRKAHAPLTRHRGSSCRTNPQVLTITRNRTHYQLPQAACERDPYWLSAPVQLDPVLPSCRLDAPRRVAASTRLYPRSKALCAFAFGAILSNPITQGARIDPEVSGHLGDRLTGIPDDPHRPPELPVEFPPRL